jgi:hypothetical protein
MTGPTPGPWKHYDDTTPAGKTCRHEIVAMGRTVARVYYADEQAAHDARLIAAAPDLLEALQSLVASCEKHLAFRKPTNPVTRDRMAAARAAIAKAGA